MDTLTLARAERADLLDLLTGLGPAQWEAPSLCAGWTVHSVVAHVVSYDELSTFALARRALRGGFHPRSMNAIGVREYGRRSPEQLLAVLRDNLTPKGLTAGFGGAIALADGLIHQQDIRRPLGRYRAIPAERLRPALRLALYAPVLGGVTRVHDLRLEATDLDWSWGPVSRRRPVGTVHAPAEALLMAIAGRHVAPDLAGDGAPVLAARLG